jgi:hypothetical protein
MPRPQPFVVLAAGLATALAVACAGDGPPAVPPGLPDSAIAPDPTPDAAAVDTDASAATPDAEPAQTRLELRVVDSKSGLPLPAMVSFFEADSGKMLNFGIIHRDDGTPSMGTTVRDVGGALATWHGFALWRGHATFTVGTEWDVPGEQMTVVGKDRLPYGRYRLIASRGPEYELAEARIELTPGQGLVTVELPLAHTVDTSGYLAADMHLHAAPGSSDSRIQLGDRLKTLVVSGVEVGVAADHDYIADLTAAAQALWGDLGERPPVATVNGNEVTLADPGGYPIGHFNLFPVVPDGTRPRHGATVFEGGGAPSRFFEVLRQDGAASQALVQLNHARLGWAGYFNHGACEGWRDHGHMPSCALDIDLVEVLNGYLACGSKIEAALLDWYTLLGFGRAITAVGNSDSHGTSLILAGFPRTYVRAPDDRVEVFSERDFVAALRGHRAIATTGPFLTVRVNGAAEEGALITERSGTVNVSVRMQAAGWMVVDQVLLKVNGATVKSWPVPRVGGSTPLLEIASEPVKLAEDGFITVEARGTTPLPPFIVGEAMALAGPGECDPVAGAGKGMVPFAVTNPVFVDVDGDGRWRSITP